MNESFIKFSNWKSLNESLNENLKEYNKKELLYHSTSILNAINILKDGEIKTYENILQKVNQDPMDWYDDPEYGKYIYVSNFIHNYNLNNYYGLTDLDVTFIIDSNKIKSKIYQYSKEYEGGTIAIKGNVPLYAIKKILVYKKNEKLIKELINKKIEYEIKINESLNESYLNDIDPKEIVTKEYIDRQLLDNFNVELWASGFKDNNEVDEELSDDEITDLPEFYEWIKPLLIDQCENKAGELFNEIKSDGTIDIWRIMLVDKNWINHLENEGNRLGIYWSWDKGAAEPHGGYNNDDKQEEIIIKSSIKEEYVNWIDTLRLNIEPSAEEEKEIRLFKNTSLKIEELYLNGELVDNEKIYRKLYKA